MSNNLTAEKKTVAVSMLCEGNSIRAIERMTGIHRDTQFILSGQTAAYYQPPPASR